MAWVKRSTTGVVYQIKVTLQGSKPLIWQRMQVTGATTLAQLHRILQCVMGWEGYHLYQFVVGGENRVVSILRTAGLVRIGAYANQDDDVLPTWQRSIAAVAACLNVLMKLGGVGQHWFGFDWHARATLIGSETLAAAPHITRVSPLICRAILRGSKNKEANDGPYSYSDP